MTWHDKGKTFKLIQKLFYVFVCCMFSTSKRPIMCADQKGNKKVWKVWKVRAIKLRGWRMAVVCKNERWGWRRRRLLLTTLKKGSTKRNETQDKEGKGVNLLCSRNYYYYSGILLARCKEGWFLYRRESRVRVLKRMAVRWIKMFWKMSWNLQFYLLKHICLLSSWICNF